MTQWLRCWWSTFLVESPSSAAPFNFLLPRAKFSVLQLSLDKAVIRNISYDDRHSGTPQMLRRQTRNQFYTLKAVNF